MITRHEVDGWVQVYKNQGESDGDCDIASMSAQELIDAIQMLVLEFGNCRLVSELSDTRGGYRDISLVSYHEREPFGEPVIVLGDVFQV